MPIINKNIFKQTKQAYTGLLTYVIGRDLLVKDLFFKLTGVEPVCVSNPQKALDELPLPDIVVWTGGEDVSPILYNEKNTYSNNNINRDLTEMLFYQMYSRYSDILKIGICRGGQFLNVMNGGKMIQHIANQHGEIHKVEALQWPFPVDTGTNEIHSEVNSTHHQGIVTSGNGVIDMLAHKSVTESCCYVNRATSHMSFIFQPHPEYDHEKTTSIFMYYLHCIIQMIQKDYRIQFPRKKAEIAAVARAVGNALNDGWVAVDDLAPAFQEEIWGVFQAPRVRA